MLCGGCKPIGHCRLGIGSIEIEGDGATAIVRCAERFFAGPGVAHGGWTAAVFDDAMGRALLLLGAKAVTGTLTVKYLRPVPVEEDLRVTVTRDRVEGRRILVSASLRLAASNVELSSAIGIWIERQPDHFGRQEADMREYRDTLGGNG